MKAGCMQGLQHQKPDAIACNVDQIQHGQHQSMDSTRTNATWAASKGRTSLVLQPRSLLVFKDLAYTQYLHSIDEVDADHLGNNIVNLHMHPELALGSMLPRGPERVSLTVRRVEKVVKSLLRLKNS
ncbi:alkB, alkylation repair-like protein 6 [Dunaliella salina]|uniref:AlkB, alkylation repair-like protein 6 n=1 Tax=Dunaliella salina TaxID=3046 RepID=A0ABQ7GHS7_DUNSA|nr:alkB, alkylation repair-like protein 6 [Dunaliella salina]|eukprot:KAF5834154.1 alkB, alkylation repair-like protein 6 [Dunaliella salina]